MIDFVTPSALKTSELPGIVEDYRQAAVNTREVGFDDVEVHSTNNYFLKQFVRDSTNRKDNEYGRTIANRLHFPRR